MFMKKLTLGVLMIMFSSSAFAGTLECETALVSNSGVKKSFAEAATKNGIARLILGTTDSGYQLEAFYTETLGYVAITAKNDGTEISTNGLQGAFLKIAKPGVDLSPTVEVSCKAVN
jgi:hypothetical protein